MHADLNADVDDPEIDDYSEYADDASFDEVPIRNEIDDDPDLSSLEPTDLKDSTTNNFAEADRDEHDLAFALSAISFAGDRPVVGSMDDVLGAADCPPTTSPHPATSFPLPIAPVATTTMLNTSLSTPPPHPKSTMEFSGMSAMSLESSGPEGPTTPRNTAGPFVFDGSAGRSEDGADEEAPFSLDRAAAA